MAGVDYSQFKGKPFQVISKLGVRYTGIFDHISQEDQTICLAQVFNHGTEDRPTARKLAGSSTTLGWVRFHTESIESLALVENYIPPGEEAPVDPILASVSNTAPGFSQAAASSSRSPPPRRASHDLPPKPSQNAISAATALDRVQESLHDLSVNESSGSRPRQPRNNYRPPPQAPEVPDAEFDFTKGTQAFEKEREGRKVTSPRSGPEEIGEPEAEPHPSAFANGGASRAAPVNGGQEANGAGGPKTSTVYKKSSFFDGLSGESSRISRNEERHRNYDTFGEAGGSDQPGGFGGRGRGGVYGGGRGGYSGRGGYGGQQQQQGFGGQGYGRQQGFGGDGYGRGRGRGYGQRGGYQGGQAYEGQQ